MRFKSLFLSLLLFPLFLSAQKSPRRYSVGLEFGGASSLMGLHLERPFHLGSPWNYRVGLSLSDADGPFSMLQGVPVLGKGFSVPITFSYLISNSPELRHSFEALGGLSLGYYTRLYEYQDLEIPKHARVSEVSRFGYFGLLGCGYRYQIPQGLFLRLGLELNLSFGDRYAVYGASIAPRGYLGVGLNF